MDRLLNLGARLAIPISLGLIGLQRYFPLSNLANKSALYDVKGGTRAGKPILS